MKKIIKWVSLSVLFLIVLWIAAVAALVLFIDPNHLKPIIIEKVKQTTGRTLSLQGNLHWEFFPYIGLQIEEVQLSNAKGFGDSNFASIKQAKIGVKVIPLLYKHIEISELQVNGLSLHLSRNTQGITNWRDLVPTSGASTSKTVETETSISQEKIKEEILDFNIHSLELKHVDLKWQDAVTNTQIVINDFNLSAQNVMKNKFFPVVLSLQVNNKKPNIQGPISLKSKMLLGQTQFQLKDLLLETQLQGDCFPERHLLFQLQSPQVNLSSNQLIFDNLTIQLNQTHIKAEAKIDDLDHLSGNFKIDADQLNMDPWISCIQKFKHPSSTTIASTTIAPTTYGSSASSNDNSILSRFNLMGQFNLEKLKVVQLNFQNVQASLQSKDGLIYLTPIKARCYEGTINAKLNIDARPSMPLINFDGTVSTVHIQPLLKDLMDRSNFSGLGYLTLSLSTQSLETQKALRSLQGHITFELKEGSMRGINILYFIQAGRAVLKKQPSPPLSNLNQTDFGNLKGTANIQNGIITNKDLHLVAKNLEANGQGTINLVKQTIDYYLKAFEPAQPESIIPLTIRGSWNNPSISLDMGQLLQNMLGQQVEQKKEQLVQSLKGSVQSSLERLLSH